MHGATLKRFTAQQVKLSVNYKNTTLKVLKTIADVSEPSISSIFMGRWMPMKMELIEGSETSAIKTQTPENYPKENIFHIKHGESLKSSIKDKCVV